MAGPRPCEENGRRGRKRLPSTSSACTAEKQVCLLAHSFLFLSPDPTVRGLLAPGWHQLPRPVEQSCRIT